MLCDPIEHHTHGTFISSELVQKRYGIHSLGIPTDQPTTTGKNKNNTHYGQVLRA